MDGFMVEKLLQILPHFFPRLRWIDCIQGEGYEHLVSIEFAQVLTGTPIQCANKF